MIIIVHKIIDLTEKIGHIFVKDKDTRGIRILQLNSKTILSVIAVMHDALLIVPHSLTIRRNTKTLILVSFKLPANKNRIRSEFPMRK